MTFLDLMSVPAAFVIGNLSAVGIAINFADRFPDRCVGVLNCGYSGLVNDVFTDNMPTISRTFFRTYQKSNTAIRFLTRAAIASVDFLGAHRMMNRHLGASQVDRSFCDRVGCFDVMADGLTHAIAQGGDAFIKDGYLAVTDWTENLRRLEGRVPATSFLGEQDGIAPHRFIAEDAEQIANYDVRFFPNAGQLVLFQEWKAVVRLIHGSFVRHNNNKLLERKDRS